MPEQEVELEIYPSLGFNSALNAAQLPQGSQRRAYDACMRAVNTIGKRPGSTPVTATALTEDISYLTTYRFPNSVGVGAAPTLAAIAGSNTLPSATYYVRYTYLTDQGETDASAEASQAIVLGEGLRITVPAIPYHANAINIYISTATNTEKLEVTSTPTLITNIIAPLAGTGADYPTVNTTQFSDELLAVSDDTLYSFYNGTLNATTMTDPFVTPDVYSVAFTDLTDTSYLMLVDGGNLKYYDGAGVQDITPAADGPDPEPPNDLADVNAIGIKYIWVHKGYIFVSAGTDLIWYLKKYVVDYLPETQFFRYVRNNDYVTGPGVTFANLCLIPMRQGWGVLTGSDFNDGETPDPFTGNEYLNTINGNISPRGFTKITYPGGSQTIAYLSDDGMHEIYDTGFVDQGVRQYSTRSLMKDKIDFLEYGFTDEEKQAAVAFFDPNTNWLHLSISRDTTRYVFLYDTRNQGWYLWRFPWAIGAFEQHRGTNYYGGSTGLLHAFSDDLYSDWDDEERTTGSFVDFDVYSGLLSFEFSGDSSYLHYYLVEAQQWTVKSTLDVAIIYGRGIQTLPSALKNEIMVWNVSNWNEAQWANLNYTDTLNSAKRLVFHRRAKYFQRRWRNARDEPVLILREKFIGTTSNV